MQLVIGNKNYSSWSLRPWLLMTYFALPFEEVRIPLDSDEFHASLSQYTAAGKVPVLIDQGVEIWDSLAICEYLSEQYLDNQGWPTDPVARAQARSASAEMHSSFMAVRSHMPMNCRRSRIISFTQAVLDEIQRIDQLWSQLRSSYGAQGEFLFGAFSIADCMYAPMVARFNSYQPQLGESSARYVQTVLNLPAMQQWYAQAAQETEVLQNEEVGQDRI